MRDLKVGSFFFYAYARSHQLDLKNKFTEETSLLHKHFITNFAKEY